MTKGILEMRRTLLLVLALLMGSISLSEGQSTVSSGRVEVRDGGASQGRVRILDFTGAGVAATVSGGVATIDVSGGGGSSATVLVLGSDITTAANTTPVDLTGMVFTATAATRYKVEFLNIVTAAANSTGNGFGVNCTAAPQTVSLIGYNPIGNTGTMTQWNSIANNAILGAGTGVPTADVGTPGHGGGFILTHAVTTDTCQFIFRSETTAVATAKAGTTIIITELE